MSISEIRGLNTLQGWWSTFIGWLTKIFVVEYREIGLWDYAGRMPALQVWMVKAGKQYGKKQES